MQSTWFYLFVCLLACSLDLNQMERYTYLHVRINVIVTIRNFICSINKLSTCAISYFRSNDLGLFYLDSHSHIRNKNIHEVAAVTTSNDQRSK